MLGPRNLALLFVAAGFSALAVGARGQSIAISGEMAPHGHELVTENVDIRGLNLSTTAGQVELEKRVTSAINRVCPMVAGRAPHHERQDAEACRKLAWSHARPQIDHALAKARSQHH